MAQLTRKTDLNRLLNDLAEELDLSTTAYEEAKNRYDAVGAWLNESDVLKPYDPQIFPQGSIALGTAIRPEANSELDVDAVCRLKIRKSSLGQKQLKELIGLRLKEHELYARMLDPKDGGRRCWTLRYADGAKFHLDVLPAIPDPDYARLTARGVASEYAKTALLITDKTKWNAPDWPRTNPEGYAAWFKERMKVVFEERRVVMAREARADVKDVPEYKVRTPLQLAVQLLKKHCALKFKGDEDKPISIIITTLAAQAYNNEAGLFDALQSMLPKMRSGIQDLSGSLWVPNPVNPDENFADKWAETPRKAELFFSWLESIEQLQKNLEASSPAEAAGLLREAYGETSSKRAFEKYSARLQENKQLTPAPVTLPSRFTVGHRVRPNWPITLKHKAKISARYSSNGHRWTNFSSDSLPLKKKLRLEFEASTDAAGDYDVHRQVVNTGHEATAVTGGLRSGIFLGDRVREESTQYKGMHWVECFIVKNGHCVARSGEFVVNIL